MVGGMRKRMSDRPQIAGLTVGQAAPLQGGCHRRGQRSTNVAIGSVPRLDLERPLAEQREAAALGLACGQRRLDHDPEQGGTIEPGREGLADPAHGPVDLLALAVQLLHLVAELVAHPVELPGEAGDLVVALDRHRPAEVARSDPPGGGRHRGHLPAQDPQREQHEQQRQGKERHQHDHGERSRGDEAIGAVGHQYEPGPRRLPASAIPAARRSLSMRSTGLPPASTAGRGSSVSVVEASCRPAETTTTSVPVSPAS